MVQNASSGISDIEENSEQRPVLRVGADAPAQGLGILERRERPVDSANDFPERDPLCGPLELVAAVGPAHAHYDPRPLQIEENRLKKLFGQLLFGSNLFDLDDIRGMLRKHR